MWLRHLLNSLILLLLLHPFAIKAEQLEWEVATVFLGSNEDQNFQKDIDQNILELSRLKSTRIKLAIYREFDNVNYAYFPHSEGNSKLNLSQLLARKDLKNISITGKLITTTGSNLDYFLNSFFKNPKSKKALVIYGHGKGAKGLKTLAISNLKNSLHTLTKSINQKLDFIWYDACFMANLEFLYELRSYSRMSVASEESEFSAASPFESLDLLSENADSSKAVIALAQSFIESYSYLKNGRQRQYVNSSSATISVIDNLMLEQFAQNFKTIATYIKELDQVKKDKLSRLLVKKARMEDENLVDIGQLLIAVRSINSDKALDARITSMIRNLNIESVKSLRTNPRIKIIPPQEDAIMVYGFNEWKYGSKVEVLNNPVLNQIIRADGFVQGPDQKNWPAKKINSSKIVLTPFAPNLNRFDYYFIDQTGKTISTLLTALRTHDIVENFKTNASSPLLYSGYTQRISHEAERYTGLNITIPESVPSLDYYELEFNQLAQWLRL